MLIALDVGNTSTSLGLVERGEVVATRRAETRAAASAHELALTLDGLLAMEGASIERVREMVVASVVPAVSAALAELGRRHELAILWADAVTIGMPVHVDQPAEVGADRLANALAALRLHGAPAIVVDFGTATNFDVVDASGAYVGGALAPGLELGLEALATRTAKLPRIELARPARAIGTNTVAAMQSGAVIGYVGLVRELLSAIRAELAERGPGGLAPRVIATGGLSAAAWASELPGIDVLDPLLTLRGLAILQTETRARSGAAPAARAAS